MQSSRRTDIHVSLSVSYYETRNETLKKIEIHKLNFSWIAGRYYQK